MHMIDERSHCRASEAKQFAKTCLTVTNTTWKTYLQPYTKIFTESYVQLL